MKKHNFNAGPSILPRVAIENAAKAILDFEGIGLSLLEISHRTKDFEAVNDEAEALFRELLHIPDNYKVLFLGGGASTQFFEGALQFSRKESRLRQYGRMGQEGDQRGQIVRRGRGARFLGRQELHLYSERIRHPVGFGLSAHYLQQYDLRHGVPHRHRFAGSADRRYEFRHSEPSGRREQVRDDLRRRAEEHRSCRRDVRHRAGGRAGQGFPSAALDGRLPQSTSPASRCSIRLPCSRSMS